MAAEAQPPKAPSSRREGSVGISLDELTHLLVLDGLKGFGPQKFREVYRKGLSPGDVLEAPHLLPLGGRRREVPC